MRIRILSVSSLLKKTKLSLMKTSINYIVKVCHIAPISRKRKAYREPFFPT